MSEPPSVERKSASAEAIQVIVRTAVMETLSSLGFDAEHPTELQADMYYLRRLRRGGEEARGIVRHSLLTVAVSTVLYLLWEAIRHSLPGQS